MVSGRFFEVKKKAFVHKFQNKCSWRTETFKKVFSNGKRSVL